MFAACSLTKFIVSRGIAAIVLQVIVGVSVYGIILIKLRDQYVFMLLRKILLKLNPNINNNNNTNNYD